MTSVVELEVGAHAPDFKADSVPQGLVSLGDLKGRPVVLYFYPKDNTSGCTQEACDFRDLNEDIKALGAVVLGVSKDSIKSHQGFAAKHELTFPLLSDPDLKMMEGYGVWCEKTVCGKTSLGVERSTFLIDGEGRIRRIWRKVKVAGHSAEVLKAVRELVAQ